MTGKPIAVHRRCNRTRPSAVLFFFAAILLHLSSSCCCYAFQISTKSSCIMHAINCRRRRPYTLSNMAKLDREEEDGSVLGASLLFAGTGKWFFFLYHLQFTLLSLSIDNIISQHFNFIHQLSGQV